MRNITTQEAYFKVTTLCSRREQCSGDIKAKLLKWAISNDDAEIIINRLIEERYIDDVRFACAFARDKSKFEGWGKIKIAYKLRSKGIPASVIENSLAEIEDNDYHEKMLAAMQSKAKRIKDIDAYKFRASLYRFGISRGFESQDVMKIIDQITLSNED